MVEMHKTIKAKFSHGVLEPLERLDFSEGEEINITIDVEDKPIKEKRTLYRKNFLEALDTTAGGWEGLVDGEELKKNIYNDRLQVNRPNITL